MSPTLTYLISADYARTTGGWIYNERLLRELAGLGWRIDRIELPAGFPDPSPETIAAADAVLDTLPAQTLVLADQVVLSPLAAVLKAHADLAFAMIMHHPQLLEGSRPAAVAARMDAQERAALVHMTKVIATSRATAEQMTGLYGVAPSRLITAEPGTDPQTPSPGSGGPGLHLISLGSVIPRKRHELIVDALAGLADLDWRFTIAGNLTREPAHVTMLRQRIDAAGLSHRIDLAGELSGPDLDDLWRRADLYVASSRHEGFGMAIAEAVARSIPVVSTRSGAVGSWLDPRASILVEPDDVVTMAMEMQRVLTEPGVLQSLRDGAGEARANLATWPQSAAKVSEALL
jgi:glycosyltransferase involved in cell wall biosynthesis